MAKLMHKVAQIRTLTHTARLHDSASIHALTGRPLDGPDRELFAPLPQFYPSYGSAVAALKTAKRAEVPFASLPFVFRNVHDVPCQGGGFLGSAFDPLRIDGDPARRAYQIEMLQPPAGVTAARRAGRKKLLAALERAAANNPLAQTRQRAYRLLASEAI